MKPEERRERFEIEFPPLSSVGQPPSSRGSGTVSGTPASTAPAVVVEPSLVTEDEEIYCPVCAYNLSGIFSGRCPECGSLFDRNALITAQRADQITLIPWDDPKPMPLRQRLFQTLRICLLNAERFAFAFSVQPQESRAGVFFRRVVAVTTLSTILAVLAEEAGAALSREPHAGFSHLPALVLAAALFAPLTLIFSTLLSGLLLAATCPHYDGKHHLRPWLNICAYAATHYLLFFPAILIAFAAPLASSQLVGAVLALLAPLTWLGCAGLCVFTMRAVISLRTSGGRGTGVFLLVLIHAGTALACGALALATAVYLEDLL